MSLWQRVFGSSAQGPAAPAASGAQARERRGELDGALTDYEREGRFDDALRVALLLADAEPDLQARVRLLGRALRIASLHDEPPRELRARYALARLDLLKSSQRDAPPSWELASLAKELERLEDFAAAAEAFRLAGDPAAEARVLVEGGRIDELEGILDRENDRARGERGRDAAFAQIEALDGAGQRRAARELVRVSLLAHPGEEHLARKARALDEKLLRPPAARLLLGGEELTVILGAEVFLGRSETPLVVASPVISRRHLRFSRGEGGEPMVEELGARNGTFLSGSRLAGRLPLRSALSLLLGGEIPCVITPAAGGLIGVEVAGQRYRLPLAPSAPLGPYLLTAEAKVMRLSVPPGAPPPLLNDGVAAAEGVDLGCGDEIRLSRGGAPLVRVLG